MFNEFQSINLFPTSSEDVVLNFVIALLCGIILSIAYRITYKGPSYSVTFVNSLIMLALISSIVVLVIGNNIARAFGLVGALSIIRFRTAIRDTMDLVFIFLSLAVGMAAGVGLSFVAVIGTLTASLIIVLLTFTHFSQPRRRHHLLQISYESQLYNEPQLSKILSDYCRSVKLVNLKNISSAGVTEAYYHVTFRNLNKSPEMVQKLTGMPSVSFVNVYFDEDDYNPPTM